MKREEEIPKDDLKTINDSFKKDSPAVTILKGRRGTPISFKKDVVNERGYAFDAYRGKTLRHDKSLIPKGGKQITIGRKGQKYDDIPLEDRKRVAWFPSDFE